MGTSRSDLPAPRTFESRSSKRSSPPTPTTFLEPREFDPSNSRRQPARAAKSLSLSAKTLGKSPGAEASANMAARASPRSGRSFSSAASSDDGRDVRYTKTGRVSKALKGRAVHKCDICEKCYTRAEHLRRHQLNHKDARPWLCDVPGCEKSLPNRGFYREDLLLRHIEDHKTGPTDPMTETNLAAEQRHLEKYANIDIADHYRRSPSVFSNDPSMNIVNPMSDLIPHCSLGPSCETSTPSLGPACSPFVPNSLQTPSLYGSPAPDHSSSYQPYFLNSTLAVDSWHHSQFDLNRSASPISVVSSFNIPAWHEVDQKPRVYMMSPPLSEPSAFPSGDASIHGLAGRRDSLAQCGGAVSVSDFDVLDEVRINSDIAALPAILNEPQAHSRFQALQDLYMPAFWQNFYPTFPIIHRPTFNSAEKIPPLLKALMTAIGASYVNDPTARIVSRALRNTCSSLLNKRPDYMFASSRIWDLHIVFLAEVFTLFRSRRPETRLSSRFETICATLHFDSAVSAAKTPEDLEPMAYSPDDEMATSIRSKWISNESKRRIFLACYVLEAQRSSLFQQERTISDDSLPFTCSTPLWEARDLRSWSELAQRESYNPQQLYHALHQHSSIPYDTFTSAIVTAYVTSNEHPMYPPPKGLDSIVPHPRNSLSYHAMMLANHTPIKDLLAVSGDSFVFNTKLSTHGEYEQAYVDLRLWVNSQRAGKALSHAVKMLKTAYENGRCGLLHEEWSLYIAALVCWACGMWGQGHQYTRQESPSLGIEEQMGTFLAYFDVDGGSASADANNTINEGTGTRACLAWVQQRISGQIGGLVEDAVTVLDKLVTSRIS